VTGETATGFGSLYLDSGNSPVAVLHSQCSDGFDNDGKGGADHPEDPGCASPDDDSERLREDVEIDIEPLHARNLISLASHRPIFVAVLGSESVDAGAVDADALAFGPDDARPREKTPRRVDVNRDGYGDALVSFDLSEKTGIALGDTEACLAGQLTADAFRSCDAIEVLQGMRPRLRAGLRGPCRRLDRTQAPARRRIALAQRAA